MKFLINYVNALVPYVTTPADFIEVDLVNDYLIWTAGDAVVKDLMTSTPTISQLNEAATIIDDINPTTVALCLLMDYSHDIGGAYYTHKVLGMSENKKYVFCFSFDGATATEPQLEAWDTSAHTTANNHVLGAGTALNSFVKAVCTTTSLPGTSWSGTELAGASNVLLLNDGNGALSAPGSGLNNDLYANIKVVIPTNYNTPAAETFVLTVRYTYL
jgi:hypothetical protein